MVTSTRERRQEVAADRALARSALYQLLSQALAYPTPEAVAAIKGADLPRALEAAPLLAPEVVGPLSVFAERLRDLDAAALSEEHRRVFTHVMSADCPPCETFYTASHVFQETQDMSDIAGFFRAFGLELSEKGRPDHVSVELEFMQFLAYKEAYALANHGPAKARLCREAQRKFMRDHLGRWVLHFTERLSRKAGGGYFAELASLAQAFLFTETAFLRTPPGAGPVSAEWRRETPDGFSCPLSEGCA